MKILGIYVVRDSVEVLVGERLQQVSSFREVPCQYKIFTLCHCLCDREESSVLCLGFLSVATVDHLGWKTLGGDGSGGAPVCSRRFSGILASIHVTPVATHLPT